MAEKRSSSSSISSVPPSSTTSSVQSAPLTSSSVPSSAAIRVFSLAEIKKATNNFDKSLLLGKTWMGEIHKGTYIDGDEKSRTITVKSYKNKDCKDWLEKRKVVWPQYCHEHIVSVIGYCNESNMSIVVYEDMANGSLAQYLCAKITPSKFYMPWEQCLDICIQAARGLEYMHSNIKIASGAAHALGHLAPYSIFLDENSVAKITDLFLDPKQPVNECLPYHMDTHYQSKKFYNISSDVYCFGVLLVKVLSRKVSFIKEDKNLGIWFNKCILNGSIQDLIIHPEMKAEIPPHFLSALLDIVGECLCNKWTKRPSMNQVVEKLELLMASCSSQRSVARYSLREITDATDNFENTIGEGGEGKVYKGVIKTNGTTFAVKRLNAEFSSEFEKEIKMLSDLDHPNLVSLVGYCYESDQNILIYELMSNGDLAQSLNNTATPLSWLQRLNICIGAARGLRYLHTRTKVSQKGIIHRDIKPVNILLDENFNAKISDFGLSKIGPHQQANSEISTMLKGTVGYFAPEYQEYGHITRKIDVYAFGVVLCEVLCRKKPWDRDDSFYATEDEKYEEWVKENIDSVLAGFIAPFCLEAFVGIVQKCLNMNPKRRPCMNEVVSVLENALKWQEAWETQKSTGDFCLPGGKDRLVLYCKSNSESSIIARLLLRRFTKNVEERDLQNEVCLMEFKHGLGNIADMHKPQIFVQGKHVGDINEIKTIYSTGKLAKFLGLPDPQFNCDNCNEARKCPVCQQIERYIHCNNCGALTVVSAEWKQLRSCHECRADQLTYGVITFICYNWESSGFAQDYLFIIPE